mmetsp:Transcript_43160/g.80136  ORF Transcript_43160/g.80136 Transcript_43160/m.80136 type:complete len:93 (+) Transcript_43160:2503-2781(+)
MNSKEMNRVITLVEDLECDNKNSSILVISLIGVFVSRVPSSANPLLTSNDLPITFLSCNSSTKKARASVPTQKKAYAEYFNSDYRSVTRPRS